MSLLPFGRNNLRQSHLPRKDSSVAQLLVDQRQAAQNRLSQDQAHSPLTFSQALTITAGMAGLVGLLSGVLVRFSLANSSNARFLSPLQTFPELSDWSSEPTPDASSASVPSPEATSPDVWQSPADLDWDNDWDNDTQDFDTFSSESFTDSESTTEITLEGDKTEEMPFIETEGTSSSPSTALIETDVRNFDSFANRGNGQRQVESVDPLKALSRGPLLRKPTTELPSDEGASSPYESTSQDRIEEVEEYGNVYNEDYPLSETAPEEFSEYEGEGDYYENESW